MIEIKTIHSEHIFTYKGSITLVIDDAFVMIWFCYSYEYGDMRGMDTFWVEDIEYIRGI